MFKLTHAAINIDCTDPPKMRDFYANLTGWKRDLDADEFALLADSGTTVYFMVCDFDYAPPVWPESPGKQQKQMHFDFCVDDLASAVQRALELGATKAAEQYAESYCVVMLDPEGHPFCLLDPKLHPYNLNKN